MRDHDPTPREISSRVDGAGVVGFEDGVVNPGMVDEVIIPAEENSVVVRPEEFTIPDCAPDPIQRHRRIVRQRS